MIISNTVARHAVLHTSQLSQPISGPCDSLKLIRLIKALGYVQQDPLLVIARAHDHILWSRFNQFRPPALEKLMHQERKVFEHFTHDACVLPMETLPYWKNQFARFKEGKSAGGWNNGRLNMAEQQAVINRIRSEGPLCSKDFKSRTKNPSAKKQVWSKPAHKQTLDYLWLTGKLAVSKRVKFSKYYDLAERIYPQVKNNKHISNQHQLDWLCVNAIKRLGFANAGEIMRFWEACNLSDVKSWLDKNQSKTAELAVTTAAGDIEETIALKSQLSALRSPPTPSKRLRVINPFDPIVRDRKRPAQLFGFDYRIEIYIPAQKRQFGYYVYPLLEFDRFVGRAEIRHNRELNQIFIDNLWAEPGIKFGKGRMAKLNSELQRLRVFVGASDVIWSK